MRRSFILAFIFFVAGCGGGLSKEQQEDAKRLDSEKAIEVTADELMKEFKADPEKTDQKYNGKVVQVTGKIEKVEVYEQGRITLDSSESGMYKGTSYVATVDGKFMPTENEALKKLARKCQVTFKGICTGKDKKGFPSMELRGCKLVDSKCD